MSETPIKNDKKETRESPSDAAKDGEEQLSKKQLREAKLADALRANLRRRKQ